MSEIITATRVSKTLGNVRAVDGVSLSVERGEFLSILGASGSGKTTLLGLLAGLDRPDEGSIVFESTTRIHAMTEDQLALFRRVNVGFVYQSFNLLPTLTVIENIAFPLFPVKMDRSEMRERARKGAEAVGLGHRLDHYPNELSGGEQQRVAIARALINHPKILFADEPTGNLDSATGEMILDLLLKINREQELTLVVVTHDQGIAGRSDRVVRLEDGRIKND
jgi:predicted ABC-type transport system involved in lysophospholipase L1 biosynthesis ATPase subunit